MGNIFSAGLPMQTENPKKKIEKVTIRTREDAGTFSVATYNVLADSYSLYQNYCDAAFLKFDYRKVILAEELQEFNTDFICLQEVDKYNEFFKDLLHSFGYESHYVKRPTNWKTDGSLIAWKSAKWAPIEIQELNYNEHEFCKSDPEYIKDNIGILIVFQDLATKNLQIIGTSHFYWDPALEYVKFLQAEVFSENAYTLKEKFLCEVVLTGDLNSMPESYVINYLTNKKLDFGNTAIDKKMESIYKPNELNLKSSYEDYCAEGYPEFTNYTRGFKEVLDYIFYSEGLETISLGKVPNSQDFKGVIGIPNQFYPSDHLPLITYFARKQN